MMFEMLSFVVVLFSSVAKCSSVESVQKMAVAYLCTEVSAAEADTLLEGYSLLRMDDSVSDVDGLSTSREVGSREFIGSGSVSGGVVGIGEGENPSGAGDSTCCQKGAIEVVGKCRFLCGNGVVGRDIKAGSYSSLGENPSTDNISVEKKQGMFSFLSALVEETANYLDFEATRERERGQGWNGGYIVSKYVQVLLDVVRKVYYGREITVENGDGDDD